MFASDLLLPIVDVMVESAVVETTASVDCGGDSSVVKLRRNFEFLWLIIQMRQLELTENTGVFVEVQGIILIEIFLHRRNLLGNTKAENVDDDFIVTFIIWPMTFLFATEYGLE